MEYRNLGKSGLKVSSLSFGSWITFGKNLDLDAARECMRIAYEAGVNFFDTAEVYANGIAEMILGELIKDYRRESLVISTKIFWGGNGPNDEGLSHKHLMEGLHNSLKRLQLEYVDLLFCHRPDPNTPIEETVRAMDILVRSGKIFYWGTSEWSASQIEEAHRIARQIGATPPLMEQPEYHLFHRNRVEEEYRPLYEKYGMGTTIWSPLDSGILTGKYNAGIPAESRLARESYLQQRLSSQKIEKVKKLGKIAEQLDCSLAQLAIAWCLKNPRVSTVITGASSSHQMQENLAALGVVRQISEDVRQQIENALA